MGLFDFNLVRKSVDQLGARLKELDEAIEEQERARERVLNAAIAREDAMQFFAAVIDRQGAQYLESLRRYLGNILRKPDALFDPARVASYGAVLSIHSSADAAGNAKSIDRAVCLLMGDQLKSAMNKALDLIEWPEDSMPLGKREVELQRIERVLDGLKRERLELRQSAREAGLTSID